MLTKNTFEEALHNAMRLKDDVAKNTFKILLASLKMMEIEKGTAPDEAAIQGILQKEIKMRRESISEFEKGGRQDLIKLAEAEITILQKYLPAQMGDEEIMTLALQSIKEVGASTPAEMGKVMKDLMPKLAGKAAADRISAIVKALLA